MPFDESVIPQDAAQAEALINQMGEPGLEGGEAPPAEAAPAPKYKINYKGKEEEYDLDKILGFANQGRDYAQRMQDFNAKERAFLEQSKAQQTKWSQLEERLNRYNEVESYIKKDPAWWDHVQKSYQERSQVQSGNPGTPADPNIQKMIEEAVGPLRDFVSSAQKEREAAQLAEEDRVLDSQVQEYRTKYPTLDWNTVDENGHNLEKRILDHAIQMGLNKPEHFRVAANDYLFDEHIKLASGKGREGLAQDIQKANKLGLGPVTDRPTIPARRVENVSTKSWGDVAEEAKAAFGIN